jgi:sulfite exporter TauE/SafE
LPSSLVIETIESTRFIDASIDFMAFGINTIFQLFAFGKCNYKLG